MEYKSESGIEVLTFDEAKRAGIQFQTGDFNPTGKIEATAAHKVLQDALRSIPESSLTQLRGYRITVIA